MRHVTQRGLELVAGNSVRHAPEILQLAQLAADGAQLSDRLEHPPAHAPHVVGLVRHRLDRLHQLRAGDRMPGKSEALERRELDALPRQRHQRVGEVRQIGPFVHHIRGARVGEAGAVDILRHHEIEPRAAPRAVIVARAQKDRAHAAVARLAHALLDLDAHLALAHRRVLRRVLVDHRRHAFAEIPHAAGKHQRRAAAFRRGDGGISERQRIPVPFGDDRIERVEDDIAALRCLHSLVPGHRLDGLDALRNEMRLLRPHQAFHSPARVAECLCGGEAEAAARAKHKNGSGVFRHARHLPKVARAAPNGVSRWRQACGSPQAGRRCIIVARC